MNFDEVLNPTPRSHTEYGYVTEAEFLEREAQAYAKALAVVECHFCDDEGYRGHIVCDHVDRRKTYATGMRKVARALKNPNLKGVS